MTIQRPQNRPRRVARYLALKPIVRATQLPALPRVGRRVPTSTRRAPASLPEAKSKIDGQVEAALNAEIKAEIDAEIEREATEDRKAAHRQRTRENVSEAELHRRAVSQIEGSFDERRAKKQNRYIVLLNEKFTAELYRHIHDLPEKRTALCFSGGGIRSASFGLGIVQGLARYCMLGNFDYLSTVSGGGYLGSWLSAWIYRSRLPVVIKALKNEPEKNKLQPEPEPIRHLRSYSNYLNRNSASSPPTTWRRGLSSCAIGAQLAAAHPVHSGRVILPRIVVGRVQVNLKSGLLVDWAFWLGTVFGLLA